VHNCHPSFAFNAQGSKWIIVAVQVGAVKTYAAAVEALRKKERQGCNSENRQIWWFSEFHARLNANVLFFRFFFFGNFILFMTKLRLLVLSFPDFRDIPISVIREVTLSLGPSLTLWSLFHPQFECIRKFDWNWGIKLRWEN